MNILSNWNILALTIAAVITLSGIILWRIKNVRFSRSVILSATMALILFQLLFFLPNMVSGTSSDILWFQQLGLTAAVILTVNAIMELTKWTLIEFVIKPKRVNIPHFLLDLSGWFVLLGVGLLVVNRVFGVELTGFLVSSTVASAIVALSLQQILSSLFAGISLQIEAPFQVDDWVEVDGQEGKVVRQNWRTLAIVTRKNEYVVLPNGNVAQDKIINYSRPSPLVAFDVFVGVAYTHPPSQVKAILAQALVGLEGVETSPAPQIILIEYADFAINYRVRFWYRDYAQKNELRDAVSTRLWYALRRAEMTIPFPIRDVNLRMVTPERTHQQQQARHAEIVDALRPVALFEEMSDEQIQHIAQRTILHRYTAGEWLMREGEPGDSLFIIKSGDVSIYVAGENGHQVHVANRSVGDFIGEMSLLTGEPRSASIIANTETEMVIFDKEAFTEVLASDASVLELLLKPLERRRIDMQTRLSEDDTRRLQNYNEEHRDRKPS
ncbi:mechanosensitive ion channel [Chloroflexi bacterium TSY]|nr:mechanosensitive ion channel [Chloroflexi bacterium TSY]